MIVFSFASTRRPASPPEVGGIRLPASHEFLEHVGEVRLRVRGGCFEELVEEAGRALAELELRGADRQPAGPWEEIEVVSRDRARLLVEWLNELIFRAETHRWVALEFDTLRASATHLTVRARGATLEAAPALVKAATLHGLRVEPVAGGVEADVVLDI